jgi:mRNA-degrading endonuclease RelE of RelBE toxin-antitoxin system
MVLRRWLPGGAAGPGATTQPDREGLMASEIEFSPNARDHLQALRKRDQRIIVDATADQVTHQPDQPTARRKPLADNPLAPWELRVGDFRVFYDLNRAEQVVVMVAVGEKSHDRLRIGGEEIKL